MHRRIYGCLLVRNVSRSRSWKETPRVSVAPSGMCPWRSGEHLHVGTLTALGNNSAFAWFFFFFFNCLPCTHAQTQALTLIPADSANKDSEMPLLQHQWTQIWWGKVRHKHSSIKKKSATASASPSTSSTPLITGCWSAERFLPAGWKGKWHSIQRSDKHSFYLKRTAQCWRARGKVEIKQGGS